MFLLSLVCIKDKFQIRILFSQADGYEHTERDWLQTKPTVPILKILEYTALFKLEPLNSDVMPLPISCDIPRLG